MLANLLNANIIPTYSLIQVSTSLPVLIFWEKRSHQELARSHETLKRFLYTCKNTQSKPASQQTIELLTKLELEEENVLGYFLHLSTLVLNKNFMEESHLILSIPKGMWVYE